MLRFDHDSATMMIPLLAEGQPPVNKLFDPSQAHTNSVMSMGREGGCVVQHLTPHFPIRKTSTERPRSGALWDRHMDNFRFRCQNDLMSVTRISCPTEIGGPYLVTDFMKEDFVARPIK